ncbi:RNA polymerase sigma factor [Roseateles sp. DB2]|uniref:RNA polymerase sigma factor n=1 Tax=Roseateles sp. DB2 TaxID=3453717 RepID=UPI003EECD85A
MTLDDTLPHLPRLRRHARLLTGDASRADDLLQDTLEQAARKSHLWEAPSVERVPGAALRAWLLTLMHRRFLNQWREEQAHRQESLDESHELQVLHASQESRWQHRPHEQLQLRLDLERGLAALPLAAREVLLLVCVEELSYEAAAQVLEVPVGTVMSRLSRARERLRVLMNEPARPVTGAPALRVVK